MAAVLLLFVLAATRTAAQLPQTNLLLIMHDDLRIELNAYGRTHMDTPNYDKLASKSVIFDKAFAQISVCNPSRDSMLTGLRPDTVGTYGFQSSFRPHLIFPTQLVRSGYNTAGYGKIAHWEGPDSEIWTHEQYDNKWYEYQNEERRFMNSSTMPDKVKREEDFRDYDFTSRAIESMRKLSKKNKYFVTAIGYKLPHLAVHLPHKYYAGYKGKEKKEAWKLTKKELRFPMSSPEVSYRCCADPVFKHMNQEGALPAHRVLPLGDINSPFTEEMHDELMMGYCGSISFLDTQIGRLLDAVDELKLWNNLTIVLSADHGMHNGEKGIWEKWSMFDESTRVPLMFYHPLSPYKGKHYTEPVELIDIFPTVIDLLNPPYDRKKICITGTVCHALQGKSLAPVVLGDLWNKEMQQRQIKSKKKSSSKRRRLGQIYEGESSAEPLEFDGSGAAATKSDANAAAVASETSNSARAAPVGRGARGEKQRLRQGGGAAAAQANVRAANRPTAANEIPIKLVQPGTDLLFAMSQSWRCANKERVLKNEEAFKRSIAQGTKPHRYSSWWDCDKTKNPPDEISVMGYSMRTSEFRYTAWFHYNRPKAIPLLDVAPFAEELYDHRGETLADFTHLETVNLVQKPGYDSTRKAFREQLITYIRKNIVFRGPFKG
jgi:arylsulfatase A-like enzyme